MALDFWKTGVAKIQVFILALARSIAGALELNWNGAHPLRANRSFIYCPSLMNNHTICLALRWICEPMYAFVECRVSLRMKVEDS